jgi:hypothetical protein
LLGWKVRLPLLTVGLQASHYTTGLLRSSVLSPGRLNGAGEVHAKGTRRKRETLRGYAPRAYLIKSGVPGQVVRRGIAPLAILARTEVLWPTATLVSVPLLLWRGGTWLRLTEITGAETLNLRGVRW